MVDDEEKYPISHEDQLLYFQEQERYYSEMLDLHKEIVGSSLIRFIEIDNQMNHFILLYLNLSMVRVGPFYQFFLNNMSFSRKKDIASSIIRNDEKLKREFAKLPSILEKISKFRNKLAHRKFEPKLFDYPAFRRGEKPAGFFIRGKSYVGEEPITLDKYNDYINMIDKGRSILIDLEH